MLFHLQNCKIDSWKSHFDSWFIAIKIAIDHNFNIDILCNAEIGKINWKTKAPVNILFVVNLFM